MNTSLHSNINKEINKLNETEKYIKLEDMKIKNIKKIENKKFEFIRKKYALLNKKDYEKYQDFILKLWDNGIDKNKCYKNADILNIVGLYYYYYNENENAVKYFEMSVEKNNILAMYNLGFYYFKKQNYIDSEKYLLMAYSKGMVSVSYELGYLYSSIKNYKKMCEFYLISINKDNNYESMGNYASYCLNNGDLEKGLLYLKISSDNGNYYATNNLAIYYFNDNNFKEAEKYFLMAFEMNSDVDLIYNIILLYSKTNNCEELIKYSLFYFEKETTRLEIILKHLNKIFNFCQIKLYNFFLKINNKNEKIKNILTELEKNNQVIVYKNKIRVFKELNNYKKCSLCLEDNVLNIVMNCFHEICIDCYSFNMKCYYKWCCNN
jgi:tetratricopeptide (TPR) repeat protein